VQRKSIQKQRNLSVHEQSNDFAKTKRKEQQRQCKIIRWHTTKFDQFTSETVSNSHTVNIESQEHYWNEKADQLIKIAAQEVSVIDNMKAIIISFVKKRICKETKLQWLKIWKNSIKKENQYWKIILNVNLSHKSLKELRKIDKLTFSIFIQLKMKHDYFKSYLHRLSENNSNKCYKICNARQTLKHLLLNCRHYRAEQRKLKKKAQLKNTDIILTLFIIKIERIATLKYLKNTWITTRKWLLETKE